MMARPRHAGRYISDGIVVSSVLQTFEGFLAEVGPQPSPAHTIDRIDNARGYEPGNIRWATRKEQARNTRRNRRITFDGKSLTVAEWAERTGLAYNTLFYRLQRHGWSVEAALTTPVVPGGRRGRS